jgi:hypothetical protein
MSLSKAVHFTNPHFQRIFLLESKSYPAMAKLVKDDPYVGNQHCLDLFRQLARKFTEHGDNERTLRFVQLQKLVETLLGENAGDYKAIVKGDLKSIKRLDSSVRVEFEKLKSEVRSDQPRCFRLGNPKMSMTLEPQDLGKGGAQWSTTNMVTTFIRAALT